MALIVVFTLVANCMAKSATDERSPTEILLDRTSREVSDFLEKMSDVKCTENVVQEKLTPNGHREYVERATYDYLILLQGGGDEFLLSESRLLQRAEPKPRKNLSLLITNGFSTLFLIFHPYYRESFQFEAAGDEIVDGRRLSLIRFTHLQGARTPAALSVRGREYPLRLTGTAWIVPETGRIARIDATLANDMQDIGLRALSVQVNYASLALPGWDVQYRFPVQATVEVETLQKRWRNVHEFSDYKRFTVASESVVSEKPK